MRRILTIVLTITLTAPLWAYDKDTHYYLTYYMCRMCGYTRTQAHRLASADWSIDEDFQTEPFQKWRVIVPPIVDTFTLDAQDIRVRFHAFPRSRKCWFEEDSAEQAMVTARSQELWASSQANPGRFFHFHQDEFAHKGYRSWWGHLSAGHKRDFLSISAKSAEAMMESVIEKLELYRNTTLRERPVHYDSGCLNNNETLEERLKDTLDGMMLINRKNDNPTMTAIPLDFLDRYLSGGPDEEAAKKLLESKLREDIPDFLDYSFDSDGNPTNKKDEYRVETARPYEYLEGYWREDTVVGRNFKELTDRMGLGPTNWGDRDYLYFRYATGIRKIAIRSSQLNWEDLDPEIAYPDRPGYDRSGRTFTFVTTPSLEKIIAAEPAAPHQASMMVLGKLKWYLVVKLTDCPHHIDVEFYPGHFYWRFEKPGVMVADVSPNEQGWGTPRKYRYRYRGSEVYNARNPDQISPKPHTR